MRTEMLRIQPGKRLKQNGKNSVYIETREQARIPAPPKWDKERDKK
ncbi:MAG: hypothetical protein DDT18_00890 [Actinobacteria bacterium]|nr:hypothetical protein [Actinomycetota bacterium]